MKSKKCQPSESLPEELGAKKELERITPSNDDLRALAAKKPPPTEYFEDDEDMPLF